MFDHSLVKRHGAFQVPIFRRERERAWPCSKEYPAKVALHLRGVSGSLAVGEVGQVFVLSPNISVHFEGETSSKKSSLSRYSKEIVAISRLPLGWLQETLLTDEGSKGFVSQS